MLGCPEPGTEPAAVPSPDRAGTDPEGDRPSLVLVVVESLRTDAVASYGPNRASPLPLAGATATPHLDVTVARGRRYDWAIAASPDTVRNHPSIFSGLRPDHHGATLWASQRVAADVELVAESPVVVGYETVGSSENPMAGPQYGLEQGFESFVTPEPIALAEQLSESSSGTQDFRIV